MGTMMQVAEEQHVAELQRKTPRKGIRKPLQMELIGGKPARQRVWEQIKQHKELFKIYDISRQANADDETVKTYLQSLVNGGYVVRLTESKFEKSEFQLIKDTGIEAPRLNRDGTPVTLGLGQEAMWRCLRKLGAMDSRQLASHASTCGVEVKEATANRYVKALKKAGYLKVVFPCNPRQRKLEVLQLIKRMDTGPRAPQIQRVKTVYDPNLNKVMHAEDPEELS